MNFPRIFHGKDSQDQPVPEVSQTPKEETLVLIVEVSKDTTGAWHCDVQNHIGEGADFDEAHRILLELATRHLTLNTPMLVPGDLLPPDPPVMEPQGS